MVDCVTSTTARPAPRTNIFLPVVNGDFYKICDILDDKERAIVARVRAFAEGEVAPIAEEYWAKDKFPFEIVPKMAALGIAGVGYQGYGAAGGSWLLNGFICMELARIEFLYRHVLRGPYRLVGRFHLLVRGRSPKGALAARDDAL